MCRLQLADEKKHLKIEEKKDEKEKKHRCKSEITADAKRSIGRQEKKQIEIEDTRNNKASITTVLQPAHLLYCKLIHCKQSRTKLTTQAMAPA